MYTISTSLGESYIATVTLCISYTLGLPLGSVTGCSQWSAVCWEHHQGQGRDCTEDHCQRNQMDTAEEGGAEGEREESRIMSINIMCTWKFNSSHNRQCTCFQASVFHSPHIWKLPRLDWCSTRLSHSCAVQPDTGWIWCNQSHQSPHNLVCRDHRRSSPKERGGRGGKEGRGGGGSHFILWYLSTAQHTYRCVGAVSEWVAASILLFSTLINIHTHLWMENNTVLVL